MSQHCYSCGRTTQYGQPLQHYSSCDVAGMQADAAAMTTDKAAAPVGESIPFGVYYSREHHNFYDVATKHGMGNEFFIRWRERADEFPAKPVAAAPVGAVPQDLPPYGIDTANHASVRIRGYTREQMQAALASQAARMGELEMRAIEAEAKLVALTELARRSWQLLDVECPNDPITAELSAAIDALLRGEAG